MDKFIVDKEPYERTVKITGGLYDAWKFYKKKYKNKEVISRSDYTKTCHLINIKLSAAVVQKSLELRLPYRLGFLRVKTYKQNIKFVDGRLDTRKNAIDWKTTLEVWEEMYPGKTREELKAIPNKKMVIHVNEHSNGYIMKWYWDKRTCNVVNNSAYVFKVVKGGIKGDYFYGRRGLSQWIKSDDRTNEYFK